MQASRADLLSPGPLRSIERAGQILRYYRKRQLLARAWKVTGHRLFRRAYVPRVTHVELRESALFPLNKLFSIRSSPNDDQGRDRLRELGRGTFILLGERRELGWPVDWSKGRTSTTERLWAFQLHYQEYLLDAVAGNDENWDLVSGLLEQWLSFHSSQELCADRDAWHPYCISRRIPVWLLLLSTGQLAEELRQRMLASVAIQADLLHRNLETDLGGNHLLENAHALALAGCALIATSDRQVDCNRQWLNTSEALFTRELRRQILPHGEHYERSPMYHVQVLGNLLQVALVTGEIAPSLSRISRQWAERMWSFLTSILHPDGEIPLFADSCFGETYPVSQIRKLVDVSLLGESNNGVNDKNPLANQAPSKTASPYWVWRSGNSAWIVDGGAALENTLPAHGHCDLAGFEASVNGVRWFIDGGTFGYSDDAMRCYCRSSLAHNVITVADKNQFDIWSRFRAGYRATIDHFEKTTLSEWSAAHSIHRAYRRCGVGRVHRLTMAHQSGAWSCIDRIERPGGRCIAGRLRLGPAVKAEATDVDTWLLRDSKTTKVLRVFGAERSFVEPGWYAPRFGERQLIETITYQSSSPDDVCLGWLLTNPNEQDQFDITVDRTQGVVVNVRCVPSNNIMSWPLEMK